MFKRKKKKTGVQTPELRKPTPPPVRPTKPNPNYVPPASVAPPKEDYCVARTVHRPLVGTEDRMHVLLSNPDYADMLKIENADVYWNDKNGAIIVVTTPEWRDYLLGNRDTPIIEKENN